MLSLNTATTDVREVQSNTSKSIWRRNLSCDGICIFPRNAPKSMNFNFGPFLFEKQVTCFFPEMPHFLCSKTLKCPIFSISRIRWGKLGISWFSNIKNAKHVINISFTGFLGLYMVLPIKYFTASPNVLCNLDLFYTNDLLAYDVTDPEIKHDGFDNKRDGWCPKQSAEF